MIRRGHCGRTDGNHTAIVEALRKAGIAAVSIASVGGGVPDVIAGFRGINILIENKEPGGRLTVAEQEFHATWPGPIVVAHDPEEAITAVVAHARTMGVI